VCERDDDIVKFWFSVYFFSVEPKYTFKHKILCNFHEYLLFTHKKYKEKEQEEVKANEKKKKVITKTINKLLKCLCSQNQSRPPN
jgi:hypothetical protein